MGNIQKAALFYTLTLVVFFYGYAVARFKIPPYNALEKVVEEVEEFSAGGAMDDKTTFAEKLQSDTGLLPWRFIKPYPEGIDRNHTPLALPGVKSRRDPPLMFLNDPNPDGYRVIIGALDFEETFWGAVLLGPTGDVLHTWHLSTEHLPGSIADHNKVLYGTHVAPDGSIIFSMQEKAHGLVKVDVCSNVVWSTPGSYHHTATSDGKGAVWSFTGEQGTLDQDMVKISEATGDILQTIDMTAVREANPDVHLWDLYYPFTSNIIKLSASGHMTHGNDIDPLTEDMAAHFEQFEVGDLLVNYASTNLVFVLDPDTLEIKWWRVGIVDFPHDPDWEADGRITIFNNQTRDLMHKKKYSEIVSIDPRTFESEIIYSGEKTGFRSKINGRHQLTDFHTRMITSSDQGWVFEIDENGEVIFSFVNVYSGEENKSLFLSNALRVPADYFQGKPWEDCQ